MEPHAMNHQLETVNHLMIWTVYMILPAFVGSYASDYFKTLKKDEIKISLNRIVLATVIAVIISQVFMEWFLDSGRRAILPFVSLVFGLLGFELLHGLSSIENMVTLIKNISKLISPISSLINQIHELRSFKTNQNNSLNDQATSDTKKNSDTSNFPKE